MRSCEAVRYWPITNPSPERRPGGPDAAAHLPLRRLFDGPAGD